MISHPIGFGIFGFLFAFWCDVAWNVADGRPLINAYRNPLALGTAVGITAFIGRIISIDRDKRRANSK